MRIIAIRGIAGSGKTELANNLASKLDAEVLHVDWLKSALKKNFPEKGWPEIRALAYDKALKQIEEFRLQNVKALVVEELFIDSHFVSSVQKFCESNAIPLQFIRVERSIEQLLEAERGRAERPIENSRQDLEDMEQQLDAIKISGERIIRNNGSIEEAAREIEKIQ
jgi:hypothetical protein